MFKRDVHAYALPFAIFYPAARELVTAQLLVSLLHNRLTSPSDSYDKRPTAALRHHTWHQVPVVKYEEVSSAIERTLPTLLTSSADARVVAIRAHRDRTLEVWFHDSTEATPGAPQRQIPQ